MFSIPKNNNILEFIGICNELPKSELEKKEGPKIIGSSVLKEYETSLLGTPFCLPNTCLSFYFFCVFSPYTPLICISVPSCSCIEGRGMYV